ncbi:MAG: hypothetical protein K2R98_20075 [Gemmataceae bacterium]|nr:hypothetical protein [Gemmataceae bacterium]
MTADSSPPLTWVSKRDGRLVPFEADKISRALFAATEDLGHPDAFLARELTDGVLHFLAAECEGRTPTTAQVADVVTKVVRELGHPALSQSFARFTRECVANGSATEPLPAQSEPTPLLWNEVTRAMDAGLPAAALAWRLSGACLREYSRRTVFARDLMAVHDLGLLRLENLHAPLELAAALVPSAIQEGVWADDVRNCVGEGAVIDSPEYTLIQTDGDAAEYVRGLRTGLRDAGLHAVVNLNCAQPPVWAGELAEGPLFSAQRQPPDRLRLAATADALVDQLPGNDLVRIDWHLAEADLAPDGAARLHRLVRRAVEGANVAFVFDRPNRPVALAEGINRRHPAALLRVGLNLPLLAEQSGTTADAGLFLQKMASLARMALSAAAQKRDFLRRQSTARPALARGFLLDRARLVVVPIGLDAVVTTIAQRRLAEGGAALELGRQIVQRLREVLSHDGKGRHLDACVDGPAASGLLDSVKGVEGLTAWDSEATPKQQLRTAGGLHGIAEHGTAALRSSPERPLSAEALVELLHYVWHKTDVVRLRCIRPVSISHQLTASWATG